MFRITQQIDIAFQLDCTPTDTRWLYQSQQTQVPCRAFARIPAAIKLRNITPNMLAVHVMERADNASLGIVDKA